MPVAVTGGTTMAGEPLEWEAARTGRWIGEPRAQPSRPVSPLAGRRPVRAGLDWLRAGLRAGIRPAAPR
jgi:hypothetical protein